MFTIPPQVTLFSFTTNAVANTNTTTAIIAAPGVARRLRIIAWHVSARRTTTGLIDCLVQDTGGSSFDSWGLTPTVLDYGNVFYHFPGIQLDENLGVQLVHTATVATQSIRFSIQYYTDIVN